MMEFAFGLSLPSEINPSQIHQTDEIFSLMFGLLETKDDHYLFSICWCIAWAGKANIFPDSQRSQYVRFLAKMWIKPKGDSLHRVTSWALSKILIPSIPKQEISKIPKLKSVLNERYKKPENDFDRITSVYLGIILGELFDAKEVTEIFNEHLKRGERLDGLGSFSLFVKQLNLKLEEEIDVPF